jgi:hypothetical protein
VSAWSERPSRAPDVVGEADVVMATSSARVLEFVMDVERYREVDAKIGRIHWVQRSPDGRQVTFRFTPRLGPVPALLRSTQHVTRHGERALVIRPTPSWTDRLARFEGTVECWPHRDGVRVRRRLEFWLAPVLRPLLGPPLRRWLATDVPAELDAARRALERGTHS